MELTSWSEVGVILEGKWELCGRQSRMRVRLKLEWNEIELIDGGEKLEQKGPKVETKWRNNDNNLYKLDLMWGGNKGANFDTLLKQ